MWAEAERRSGRSRGWPGDGDLREEFRHPLDFAQGRQRTRSAQRKKEDNAESAESAEKSGTGTPNSVPLFFFEPESGGVEDSEDSDLPALDAVGEKVRCAGNDELAGSGMTAGAAETRICAELVGSSDDTTSYSASCFRFVLFDVGADF